MIIHHKNKCFNIPISDFITFQAYFITFAEKFVIFMLI